MKTCALRLMAVLVLLAAGAPAAAHAQSTSDLVISEIMYNPPDRGTTEGALFEFLELHNRGTTPVDLSGARFSDGIDFNFGADAQLAPGEHWVLASSAAHFASAYGFAPAGTYTGKLNNDGERIALVDGAGAPLTEVTYGIQAPWPAAADGCGYSLVFDPGTASTPDEPTAWQRSTDVGGSPGAADPPLVAVPVRINEALTHTDPPQQDAVELYNPTGDRVDVGGWYLTDDPAQVRRFRIPECTWIEASGYLVLTEEQFGFALSALAEEVHLVAADTHGERLGYAHGFSFGATPNGVSVGRHVTSTGAEHFPLQITTTLGAPNAGPRVGPVVISELMYHLASGGDEYVELTSISAAPTPLYDPEHPENVWRLDGVDGYLFPPETTIPPGGTLLVVSIAPDTFRERHHIPAAVQIVGPYAGQLSNEGERIALMRPDAPNSDGSVPYFTADAVTYDDVAPWPAAADGTGPPLVRIRGDQYGDDPANWRAGWSLFLPVAPQAKQ